MLRTLMEKVDNIQKQMSSVSQEIKHSKKKSKEKTRKQKHYN